MKTEGRHSEDSDGEPVEQIRDLVCRLIYVALMGQTQEKGEKVGFIIEFRVVAMRNFHFQCDTSTSTDMI